MLVEKNICWSQKLTLCQKQQRSVADPFPKEERRSVFPLKNAVRTWAGGVRRWSVMFVIFWYSAEGWWSLADWSPHGRVSFPRLLHHQGSKHANLEEEGGGGKWEGGSGCLLRPYFTITSISQQSMTSGGFSVESLCLIFILCRVRISKCLHFCRNETVWIPIEFGPPAEQLAWRCIRQTVPWDLLVSLCPPLSHSSPQSWSMSCSITQLAGASTTGHHPFPSSSFCWQICAHYPAAETFQSTGECSILTQFYLTSTNILLGDLSIGVYLLPLFWKETDFRFPKCGLSAYLGLSQLWKVDYPP